MKKLILFPALLLALQYSAFAQSGENQLQQGLEELQREMQEMMKGFGEGQLLMDTLIFKGFGDLEQLSQQQQELFKQLPEMMESFDLESLFEGMNEGWQQLDFQQFEKLFEDFELQPLIPDPHQGPEKPKEEKKTSTKKTYKI